MEFNDYNKVILFCADKVLTVLVRIMKVHELVVGVLTPYRALTMYKFIILLPLLFALGCETTTELPKASSDGYGLPHTAAINQVSMQMVNALVRQNDGLRSDQPLIVTTPVLVNDLQTTNAFGLQFQQGLIAALHDNQFNLVDVNVSEALKVLPSGEFILSRDWQQLPADLPVEHVVVSTMSLSNSGMALTSRIVNVTNNRVVSAAQGFVNAKEMADYIRPSQKVVSEGGLLYRNSNLAEQTVSVIGEQ